jgi:hypothetical protein
MNASERAATGDWAAAAEGWEQAVALGHVPSHAALAQVYFEGRKGVARWYDRAAALAAKGSDAGCGDCKVRVAAMRCKYAAHFISSLACVYAKFCGLYVHSTIP